MDLMVQMVKDRHLEELKLLMFHDGDVQFPLLNLASKRLCFLEVLQMGEDLRLDKKSVLVDLNDSFVLDELHVAIVVDMVSLLRRQNEWDDKLMA